MTCSVLRGGPGRPAATGADGAAFGPVSLEGVSMRVRLSLRRLRLPVGLLAVGVSAVFVLPTTGAVAAQHGSPPTSQTPVQVRNGSATNLGPYNAAQMI